MATITAINPTRASGTDAKGIFPPLLRAATHVGFLLAMVGLEIAPAEDGHTPRTASNAELEAEIDHLAAHWALVIRPTYLSEEVRTGLQTITDMVPVLKTSVRAENRTNLFRNLQAFLKSILSISVTVDQSAFGLRHPEDTDAGTTL